MELPTDRGKDTPKAHPTKIRVEGISGRRVVLWESARPGFGSAASWLCDLGQTSPSLCALDSSSVGGRAKMGWLVEVTLPVGRSCEGVTAGTWGPRRGREHVGA